QVKYNLTTVEHAVDLANKFIHDRHLPDKAIDLIDEAGAKVKIQTPPKKRVGNKDIEAVLSKITKIPEQTVSADDRQTIKQLENRLQRQVFGQDKAITALVSAIKLSRAGLKDLEKPIGAFLFAGPTGVGKTEVSKKLATAMNISFLRFDMSEYREPHTVSRLIGSPPGYVGYDQGGLLTDAVSTHPHCVLLLDEIEKAHPDIFNLLLQIMDYGNLTDSNGKSVKFSHVVLVMTSNVGAFSLEKNTIGFADEEKIDLLDISADLKRVFTPEFRNRLSDVIQFSPLSKPVVLKIIDKLIIQLNEQLASQKISVKLQQGAKNWLLTHGYDAQMGARPMSQLINKTIKLPLSEKILFGDLKKGGEVIIKFDKKSQQLQLEKIKEKLIQS
ncbi:MAG: AAA family ATPase, partial [Ostreibacterium sp.]